MLVPKRKRHTQPSSELIVEARRSRYGLPDAVRAAGARAVATALSIPVRLTAVTSTRVLAASGSRCDRSQPGSTSDVHPLGPSVRTVHSHALSLRPGVSLTSTSPVTVSRTTRIDGRAGARAPSQGDAGTSDGAA